MGIADDQLHPVHAALFKRRKKLKPMHFGFGERHARHQHAALATSTLRWPLGWMPIATKTAQSRMLPEARTFS